MSLLTLGAKVLQSQLNWSNGASEEIEYTHGSSTITVKCFPQSQDELEDTAKDLESSMIFHGLKLDFKPSKNDKIEYDDTTWKVFKTKKVFDGIYDIYAYKKEHRLR